MSEEPRLEPYVVTDVPGSRRVPPRQRRLRGSILGGADQADSRLSFVVPLLELILDDLASVQKHPRRHGRLRGLGAKWPAQYDEFARHGDPPRCDTSHHGVTGSAALTVG